MKLKLAKLILFLVPAACQASVTIDFAAARAVLSAVGNPRLTRDDALRIARLEGNQGLIRKEISYGRPATGESLADALLAAAQGHAPQAPFQFHFDRLKPRAEALTALINRIEKEPSAFRDWVVKRVAAYGLPDSDVSLSGYLVAGGPSGGFAFSEPKFYLNLAYFDEFDTARVVMAHELYHAVQGAEAGESAPLPKACQSTAQLFGALYEEGSASFVGDVLLLQGIEAPGAKKMLDEMQGGLNNINNSITLLELSVAGLSAPNPVPYDDVYALGFYQPEILYKLGYVMAKAIAADEGSLALAKHLKQPGYAFTSHYLALPKYGADRDHPKLGINTRAAVERLGKGCPE